jgi:Ca2+-binding RTX toxin-like protein
MSFFQAISRKRAQKPVPKRDRWSSPLSTELLEHRELLAFDPFQQAFDINPAQSSLTMGVSIFAVIEGNEVPLATLLEQSPGSLTTALGGKILAGSPNGTDLNVYEGSYLDPVQQAGPFLPGNIPADVAGVIPNFLGLGVNIYGAATDIIAGLGPKSTTVANNGAFTLTDLPLSINNGTFTYEGGALLPLDSTGLAGNSAVYTVSGSLSQTGNQVTGFNLPVTGTFVISTTIADLNNLQLNIHFNLTGNVVATASNTPSAAILGPDNVVRGEEATYTFLALDDSVPSNASFTYQVDWDNDNVVDQTITGGSSVTTTHAFTTNGNYTYKVRVVDNGNNVSAWSTDTVSVTRSRTAVNPNTGLIDLYVGGSTGADFLVVAPTNFFVGGGNPSTFSVFDYYNQGDSVDTYSTVTGRIIGYMQAGDDIFTTVNINFPELLFGGEGNDTLFGSSFSDTINGGDGDDALVGSNDPSTAADILSGDDGDDFFIASDGNNTINGGNGSDAVIAGAGNDVINGGDGNDALVGLDGNDSIDGGNGDDILLGMSGADTIFGGAGSDLIIGGIVNDDPEGMVDGIVGEWWSGDTYGNRVGHVTGSLSGGVNPLPFVVNSTVFDDGEVDQVFGNADEDLFYITIGQDLASDVAVGETTVGL